MTTISRIDVGTAIVPLPVATGFSSRTVTQREYTLVRVTGDDGVSGIGFCYPGRLPRGGDAPPRPECAPLWQARFLAAMPGLRLTLLVGSYAQAYHLGKGRLEARVSRYRDFLPNWFPLPHPSWRTRAWAARRPWFEAEVIPALRDAVTASLSIEGAKK